uniref:Rho GTPase-activating protein 29 n=1 Tax=Strix occidentalis caurina TaxID=311401 RepID=A0A8D0KX95_STROC
MLRQNGGSNKRGLGLARLSTSNFFTISNSGNWGMGRSTKSSSLSSISSNSDCYDNPVVDPEYIMQLVNDVRKFADVLLYLKEAILSEVHERLGELLRVLKAVINKHQTLNSVDILSAAGTVIAKVKAVNFKEVNEENKRELFSEIFSSIETLAFTFGNVVSDFLMGDVDNGSSLGLPVSRRSRCVAMSKIHFVVFNALFSGHLRAEEVDSMLLRNDSGIESALSYAKAWSKYTKDVVAWVEKKLSLEVECAKNLAKMAETAKAVVGHQDYMPFQSIFINAFQNDIENNQLWQQTAAALQSNKFVQPLLGRKNELDRQRKDIKELWQREQKKMVELEAALRKAKLLYTQRQDEYEKAKSCTARAEEEHLGSSGSFVKDFSKQLEKKRRLEEEALQKAEEANEHYKASMAEVEEKRNDLESFKSDVLTQLRELIYQCDLTLKAVSMLLKICLLPENFSHLLGDFKRRLPRTPSTGTMSSADDLDEREPPSPSDCGPFRNANMSKAAQTHKLRKLRAPSKCRECDSLVVFHGAECEECSLACHKKCLETLAIQCGHKKLHGRLHLFGVEFAQAAKNVPDGIPFIIKKCTSEIENVNAVLLISYTFYTSKSRVEKLCQAFENGKDLVELSELYAHDISNVLKLYLRQLPEPLILFRLYNEFIGLAKESQNVNEELDAKQASPKSKKRQSICIELNRIIIKIKDLLKQLPLPNYNTLQYLVGHLHRVTEQSDENKMSASNLGIIFGPTLIRPRQTDATVSLSSLVDYPYQARVVELLITYYEKIFDVSLKPLLSTSQSEETAVTVRVALSAEEREPQQQRKSFIAVKEVSDSSSPSESRASETAALFLESNNSDAVSPASERDSDSFVSLGEDSCKINLLPAKPNRQITKVPLRVPRTKPATRPVSLPVDRILPPCVLNERNSRNTGAVSPEKLGRSPTIEEVSEVKAFPAVNTCCRLPCYDTQTLRKTWDKQYKQYDITARTAMIMTNVPQENRALESGTAGALSPSCSIGNNSANAMLPSKPYSVSVRSGRTATEGNGPDANPLAAFRAPRTLQPPPGTFYKPPSNKSKQNEEGFFAKACAATSASSVLHQDNTVKLARSSAILSGDPEQNTNEQKTSSEDIHPTDLKPTYQRLRPKRIQELEHREAHFV